MPMPVRPPRPAVVTVAWWLQFSALAVLLLLLWLLFQEARTDQGRIDWALHMVPDADPDEVLRTRLSSIRRHAALGAPLLTVLRSRPW